MSANRIIRWLLLVAVAILAEQLLIKYLDYKAKKDDDAFRAYLANGPLERNASGAAFACAFREITIYRYRICLQRAWLDDEVGGRSWQVVMIGVKGYSSLIPEIGGDREIWDSTPIWLLNDKLDFVRDLRR